MAAPSLRLQRSLRSVPKAIDLLLPRPIQPARRCLQIATARPSRALPSLHQSWSSQYEQRRSFHPTPTTRKDHHFDTLKFVERLKAEGFTEQQSEALLKILSDVIEESIQNLTRTMVPRDEHNSATYAHKVDFAKLRTELTTLHGNEINPIRNDQERLASEISRLGARLKEEVQKAQSGVKLDLNLEKGRIREESSVHELKVKETDTRIEKEVGDLRGMLESVKFSTLQWLIGVCTGTAALLLGVWRLMM